MAADLSSQDLSVTAETEARFSSNNACPLESTTPAFASSTLQPTLFPLSVVNTELLLHFASRTGPSLITTEDMAPAINQFWAYNVPMIGLSHHYVLYLALAIAARHMLYLGYGGTERQQELSALMDHHIAAGLAGTVRTLPNLDHCNCGPLYVAAMLIGVISVAAGPSGSDDLLITSSEAVPPLPQSWVQICRGVRSIRDKFSRDIIFNGLTEPLGRRALWDEGTAYRLMCFRQGFQRLDWTGPFQELRQAVETKDDGDAAVRLRALECISAIYEATYGLDDTGRCTVDPVFRYVFIWVYTVDDEFIAAIQRGDSASLLILAYYALLLDNVREGWYLQGWTKHMLLAVREQIEPEWSAWLKWPMEVFRLSRPESQMVQSQELS